MFCIGDEVYVEPKGALCVSLKTESSEIVGRTHRLNDAEWEDFKDLALTNDILENSHLFIEGMPDALSSTASENLAYF